MSANDTSHAGLNLPAAANFGSVSRESSLRSARVAKSDHRATEVSSSANRPDLIHAANDAEGLRMSRESGLACYWRGDSPVTPAPSSWRSANLVAKRGFDILFAAAALLALSPLFLIIGIAIKLSDPGSVFFRQDRVGRDGRTFRIFKFRSMYADRGDASGVAQTVAGDDRIMPIGAILRRTSIDELPQLINVVLGDMSLVGPRPHVAGQRAAFVPYEQVVPYYKLRHEMRPGLTGWAQANGFRGPTDDVVRARARIDHDMAYIQNFTILLDIRILVRTLLREFFNGSGF